MPDPIILFDADGNEVEVPTESPNVRQMREQIAALTAEAQRVKDLEAQLVGVQRENALTAAGLQLDADQRAALEAVHKGDWTPDLVKETAIKLKWADAPQQVANEDQAALDRIAAAQSGGSTTPPDPEAVLDAKLASATSEKEFLELYRASGRPIAQ